MSPASFPRAMSQVPCLHEYLANAARVRYPAALLRCKLDAPSACCGVFDLLMRPGAFIVLQLVRIANCISGIRDGQVGELD